MEDITPTISSISITRRLKEHRGIVCSVVRLYRSVFLTLDDPRFGLFGSITFFTNDLLTILARALFPPAMRLRHLAHLFGFLSGLLLTLDILKLCPRAHPAPIFESMVSVVAQATKLQSFK